MISLSKENVLFEIEQYVYKGFIPIRSLCVALCQWTCRVNGICSRCWRTAFFHGSIGRIPQKNVVNHMHLDYKRINLKKNIAKICSEIGDFLTRRNNKI